MNTSVAIAFGLAMVLVWCTSDTHGAVTGRCSGLAEHVDPENCVHGMVFDNCGRKVCAKGPGESCGIGMWASLGTCGEGMFCRCGRCIGCSLNTFECYDKTCIS